MYMLLVLYLKCVTLWKVLPIISVLCVYIFFVFVPSLVCPMLPVYLHWPFLIVPSIFSNLYIHIFKKIENKIDIKYLSYSIVHWNNFTSRCLKNVCRRGSATWSFNIMFSINALVWAIHFIYCSPVFSDGIFAKAPMRSLVSSLVWSRNNCTEIKKRSYIYIYWWFIAVCLDMHQSINQLTNNIINLIINYFSTIEVQCISFFSSFF